MAGFDRRYFEPVGGQARAGVSTITGVGNSMAVWVYRSQFDTASTIRNPAYFNFLRNMVYPNDGIVISGVSSVFEIGFFLSVPRSPLTGDVTLSPLKIVAS